MARIPSPSDIATVTPRPSGNIASYDAGIGARGAARMFGDMADATAQGYGTLAKGFAVAGAQIEDAQDKINSSAAYQNFLTEKLKLDQQFQTDQDYTTVADRYAKSIGQAAQKSSSIIANTSQRAQFIDQTTRWQESGINQMRNVAKAKGTDADRAYTTDFVNQSLDAALRAPDESSRQQIFDNAGNLIDSMAQKGSVTQREAMQMRKSLPSLYATKRAQTLLDSDPEGTLRMLMPGAPTSSPGLPGDLGMSIHNAAAKYNVDPDTLTRIAQVESNGQNTTNQQSGAQGPFQFMPATARAYGVNDPNDPVQASNGAARLLADNRAVLTSTLGRDPTGAELYLAHQQGAEGAAALLANPDEPAIQALAEATGSIGRARQAVLQNGGTVNMTAGDFAKKWQDRYNAVSGSTTPGQQTTASDTGELLFPKAGDWRDFLSPEKRADLIRTAQSRVDANLSHQITLQKYQDEQAQKQLKDFQTTNESTILADAAQGKPQDPNHVADMLRYRMITESGFKAWQSEMTRQGKGSDDPTVVADLDRRGRAGEDISGDVNTAITSGAIKGTTGVSLVKAAAAGQQKMDDRDRTDALTWMRSYTGGDRVEKGLINFGNDDEVDQAKKYSTALSEFYKRVDQNKENPWSVANEMYPRYSIGPTRISALPRPRMGDIKSTDDVAATWQKTVSAHDAGQLPEDQFQTEAVLIKQYGDILDQQAKQKEAAAKAAAAAPAGRRVIGAQPNE